MNALRRVGVCFAGVILGAAAWSVDAAVTCNVSVTSMTLSYDPTDTSDPVVTGSYTVSCTRLASDPNTFNWSLGANNGQQPSGAINRVALNGRYYSYELYKTAPYTNANRWQDNNASARIIGTLSFGAQLTASQSGPFDLRLAGPQTVQPAGIYTDLVTATVRNASTSAMLSQSTFSVSVITLAACTLISPPGSVNLAYTSFQPGPASAGTAFGVTCTTSTPYTMSLDATSGTLLGLTYSLSLSQSGGTGTGGTQTYSVNGSIAGGQAGTCSSASCSASQTRTLTITY